MADLAHKELWKAYKQDPQSQAYENLVEAYLPLVYSEVNRYVMRTGTYSEREDLVGVAVVGLHRALRKYDKQRRDVFGAYARQKVRGAILDEARKQDHLTRTQRTRYHNISKFIKDYSQENSALPTYSKIAEALKITESEVTSILGMAAKSMSMQDEDCAASLASLEDTSVESPDMICMRNMDKEDLRKAFRQLDERDQKVLYLKHFKECRVTEIAEAMEISAGRVSQIYSEIIVKLRVILNVDEI